MSFNIDIHCHTSAKPFMSGIGNPSLNMFKGERFTPEHPIYKLLRKPIEKFSHINLSTQSNFDRMFEGGIRVAYVSMTPMEKAFTVLNLDAVGLKNELLRIFMKEKSNYRDGFVSSAAINALTSYKITDIDTIKNTAYDIYNDLFLKELKLLQSIKDQISPNGQYVVRFPKNYDELKANLLDDRNLNVLLTVEGAHVFGNALPLPDIQAGRKNKHQKDDHNVFLANQMCKNIKDVRLNYDIPIFSVGICHHFWNGLAGHARSLANLMLGLMNQEEGLNAPLMDNGRMLIDEFAKTSYGDSTVNKIHVDVKHLSAQARKDYYAYRKQKPSLRKTPIICSHTGISMSFDTLDKWIAYVKINPNEQASNVLQEGEYFTHEQSINLCREDLVEIYQSKGLIGIQLDEKRIMGPLAFKELKKKSEEGSNKEQKYIYAKAVWANILCAIDELHQAGIDSRDVWDLFAIGSDFDGLINHFDSFESASKMNELKATMSYFMQEPADIQLFLFKEKNKSFILTTAKIHEMRKNYTADELVEKVFSGNAMKFMENFF